MKHPKLLSIPAVAVALCLGGALPASAQTPAASPDPNAATETTVYLKHDYTKSLETDKLFNSDKFVARFLGFDTDFAIFQQKDSPESIYIPKSAILYMRRPFTKGND